MISKSWRRKPIAVCVAVAILSVYSMVVLALPSAKAPSGELSISGPVNVNGENVVSGGTVFSDSLITTAEKGIATVNLSKLGRVELTPNSSLKLSFTEKSIIGMLDNGSAQVSTLPGISVSFTTKDGVVLVDGCEATSFTVNVVEGVTSLTTHSGVAELRVGDVVKLVAAVESATMGTPNPQEPGDDDDHFGGGDLAELLLFGAGAIAGVIIAVRSSNDRNLEGTDFDFGGTVTVSRSK